MNAKQYQRWPVAQVAVAMLSQRSILNEESATKLNWSKFHLQYILTCTQPELTFFHLLISYLRLSAQKQLQDRRVHARQEQLLKIFETKSPMFHPNPDGAKHVWIDSNFVRRLFSCHDNLDDLFEATARSASLLGPCLCEHSRLHPKIARRGKSS